MRTHKRDLIGERFGQLTIIEELEREVIKGGTRRIVLCLCDCGGKKTTRYGDLRYRKNAHCGDMKTHGENGNPILCYRAYINKAKERGYTFELSVEDFMEMTQQDCEYCGSSPSNVYDHRTKSENTSYRPFIYNGIDRVDNTKDYTRENCVPCCKICNRAKSDLPLDQFMLWIKNLVGRMNNLGLEPILK
jgi:5-methylcytosine-specific restriction endonuclease McrA